MPPVEDTLRSGRLRVTFADGSGHDCALTSDYHATDASFLTLDCEASATRATVLVTLHPKVDGLRLRAVHLSWAPTHLPGKPTGGRSYREVRLGRPAGPDLYVRSVDESTAYTHFVTSEAGVQSERIYGDRPIGHSIPILHLAASARPDQLASEVGTHTSASASLRLGAGFLRLDAAHQREILLASFVPELGIGTAWLDLTLSLGSHRALAAEGARLAAFAKTCHASGLRPGISLAPFHWTEAGGAYDVGPPAAVSVARPEYVEQRAAWCAALGRRAHLLRAWTKEAESSLTQGFLGLRDLGFSYFDLEGLAALSHPERPVVGAEAEHLHRGLALISDTLPGAVFVNSDLPAAYLADWSFLVRDPRRHPRHGFAAGSWQPPLFPGLPPRHVDYGDIIRASHPRAKRPASDYFAPPSSADISVAVFDLPLPTRADVRFAPGATHALPRSYWQRVEVALHDPIEHARRLAGAGGEVCGYRGRCSWLGWPRARVRWMGKWLALLGEAATLSFTDHSVGFGGASLLELLTSRRPRGHSYHCWGLRRYDLLFTRGVTPPAPLIPASRATALRAVAREAGTRGEANAPGCRHVRRRARSRDKGGGERPRLSSCAQSRAKPGQGGRRTPPAVVMCAVAREAGTRGEANAPGYRHVRRRVQRGRPHQRSAPPHVRLPLVPAGAHPSGAKGVRTLE